MKKHDCIWRSLWNKLMDSLRQYRTDEIGDKEFNAQLFEIEIEAAREGAKEIK